jgi:mono/diheme cytochrome c family protein
MTNIFAVALVVVSASLIPLACTTAAAQEKRGDVVYLDQAWSREDRQTFYWTSQGSALMSYDIFVGLEVAGSEELFRSDGNSIRYGLLPEPADTKFNPDGLPVGVTKASIAAGQFKGEWVGLTCAACHTGQLEYEGTKIRIDGGTGNTFDFSGWLNALDKTLQATRSDSRKFARLARRLGASGNVEVLNLRKRLDNDAEYVHHYVSRVTVTPYPVGPGRVDALVYIQNQLLANQTGIRENWVAPTAPAKMAFLYNAPQSSWVQWSSTARNPLLRSFTESLGTFARYDLKSQTLEKGLFDSTTDIKGLDIIEQLLRRLAPPQWPEAILGKIDRAKAKAGEQLFAQNCVKCHTTWPYRWSEPRTQGKRFIENAAVSVSVVGTDGTQLRGPAFNAEPTYMTGTLAAFFGGRPIVSLAEMNKIIVGELLKKAMPALNWSPEKWQDVNGYPPLGNERAPTQSYKAAPRDGVWGTGPFLHNGSVPNLFELLLPSEQRSKTFYIGRDFDPVKVGVDTSNNSGKFLFDTTLLGNSNSGHSFEDGPGKRGVIGRLLTDDERWALVEYLKSIPVQAGRVTPFGGPADALLEPEHYQTKNRQ